MSGKNAKSENIVDCFRIDIIMNNLRNAVNRNILNDEDYEEVEWLLKLVIKSNEFFKTTGEVDNLLANICGFRHNTKSTGRDRIVDWYFRELENLEYKEKLWILKKIAKYSFINIPQDYKGWKNILIKRGR
ncbi:hypothetical protein [Clostridium saccharobutylicum]|uniref:Uncharacterized protein n=1 Tax=Clostridium saccharobutylicum TaxID=169679 RepID=A0A1S8N3L5_CLOSA|nr:hypothetical protein [Clostridium saccharobutylicum]OOM11010.1 hypothetical protein CLOSAC_25380 [Clostridium saccharobutylicum]